MFAMLPSSSVKPQSPSTSAKMQGNLWKWTNYLSGTAPLASPTTRPCFMTREAQNTMAYTCGDAWCLVCVCALCVCMSMFPQDGSSVGLYSKLVHWPIIWLQVKSTRAAEALSRLRHVISTVSGEKTCWSVNKLETFFLISAPQWSHTIRYSDAWRETHILEGIIYSRETAVGGGSWYIKAGGRNHGKMYD